jgi:hypothetical protein
LGGTGLGAAAAGGLSATATGRGAGLAGSDAAARAGFSGTGGFASSSAMIRRIDARISSMEGSWTFAGCVISDSTSATPSRALFYTGHDRGCRFQMRTPSISSRAPDLSHVRAQHHQIHAGPVPRSGVQHAHDAPRLIRTNRSASSIKAMSWPHAIASKPPDALQFQDRSW